MTQTESKPKRSIAEWVTFGISSLILAIIVGLVGYAWLNEKDQPPILSVTKKQTIREIDGQFYVPFEVLNSGGDTAESVQIVAELEINGITETGEQQIDFLSSGETEEGAFIFSQNPRQGKLNLRVGSYKLP
ncbi:TIGR02588 family protein [Nostoc sp. UHCC 0252]|uniref:TIGR02588 family protein n=1 Tax=Nostoc sp. UHCC 0252 TaxID=3110241 RepID=UPI002B1FB6C3|nr:TIGR02588 family protein [Nostoc sp. UHCC 0252]MEA5602024.1 TIGR02588 family protein [Nostoc sp. UHCC 0252]